MRILGIDPGTKCGWALREPLGSMTSGVWDLSVARHESGGMRFVRLRGYLNELYNAEPFRVIAYEEVRHHKGVSAAHIYGGIIAVIQEWCCEQNKPTTINRTQCTIPIEPIILRGAGVEHIGLPVATIKKFATGKGNANKKAMVLAADKKWVHGWTKNCSPQFDDNEADARWIAECAYSQLNGENP